MGHPVVVVVGTGGMGISIARRLGTGRRLVLADFSEASLDSTRESMGRDGHDVSCHRVDVSDYKSVEEFARIAAEAGTLESIIHTAGVAGATSNTRQIYEVDLLGTANVIDAFLPYAPPGTSMVCIASMAGHSIPFSPELERHLATPPRDQLLQHPDIDLDAGHSTFPYALSKRGNQVRVQSAAQAWGEKGARINSVSPGLISTAMGQRELKGPQAAQVNSMIALSAAKRIGTPEDITNAVVFLCSSESSFITGTDIIVDGGVTPRVRWDASVNFG